MLFLTSCKLRKSRAEWFFVANNLALNGHVTFNRTEGEVIWSLRWTQRTGGQPQALSLHAAQGVVLMLTVTVPCGWGTWGPLHPSTAQGWLCGAKWAEQLWVSQRIQGSQRCLDTERLCGGHWFCLQRKEPRHYALGAAPFELAESWKGFLTSMSVISALKLLEKSLVLCWQVYSAAFFSERTLGHCKRWLTQESPSKSKKRLPRETISLFMLTLFSFCPFPPFSCKKFGRRKTQTERAKR